MNSVNSTPAPSPGVVIVTGGSRGIGHAISSLLAREGHAVAINYAANAAPAEELARTITAHGGRALAIRADISKPEEIRTLFEQAADLGPLTGLVNNAGITGTKVRVDEQTAETLDTLFNINIRATMLASGEAVRRMSTRHGGKGGVIVNLSSVAARLGGLPGLVPYAASKAAVETFTRGLANEVAREGIRVNAVAPGLTATDMVPPETAKLAETVVPMGRVGHVDEIAQAVAFLLSPASSYMTGSVMTVSGGR
ncbi:SDR family NAD(P)-dependent oxidoreductase [Komagataeibacter oboediens]|uniref:NAD(P)-dependent oxidoreductase n=1 Tax=Komagataeibacter oboediens TaxID=65958 RepID=A0A318QP85_9PROT|nr:SDR family oxidoreductase [Komagataeibacter oboediens]GBR30504.1 oxidoreductase [Komagataeibacter oboediens DSM 11826]MBL7234913.1 SDR family oxidoreductase [Komagataeibacter oboediens]MBT0674558.1 SDR family oxidoreductase [Komagataeibacter oboediens]MBT0677666.1 SDR family oxidoreductase [Komagataeibacter oboediens]MBV0889621.1 SDR family oxidoreductase [Komagataeibacter oboediens]